MSDKHYVGEIGTEIIVEADSDISEASGIYLDVKKPDGSIEQWDAVVVSGVYLRHISQSGDFDQDGEYSVQPFVALSGWSGRGETDTFTIHKLFC